MLTRDNRLTSNRLFTQAVRRGRRAGTSTLVVHLDVPSTVAPGPVRPAAVGFIVSKAVGPAVTRNLVKRRLRHLARERLRSLPGCAVLVVRALPASAAATYADLAADFDSALDRASGRATPAGSRA
ncbi:MAG TPA: ribonuclease P protein component [Nocardioidaceae bacterium]|nr:ribonuclease P protein component [Nocardioidaceae bacterium]